MPSVTEHYASLLAPIYVWMRGGIDQALAEGTVEVAPLGLATHTCRYAVDLGAGFGTHAIPLARNGYSVTAIDTSALLLAELQKHSVGLEIQTVEDDLLNFRNHAGAEVALILCMTDTVIHLQQRGQVEQLFKDVAQTLAPRGRFVLTFRDYTTPPTGDSRFIPVRSDANRIHTCFLEEMPAQMVVHDILHERDSAGWKMRVSTYKKLRLSPDWILRALQRVGLPATAEPGGRGMLRVTAVRGA